MINYVPNCLIFFYMFLGTKRDQTLKILTLRDAGHSWKEIFRLLKGTVNLATIRHRYKWYNAHGILGIKKRSGRPKTTSDRQDRFVIRHTLVNRRMSLSQLRQELQKRSGGAVSVSVPTLSPRLKHAVVKSYVPIKKPLLTKAQKNKRYE